MTTEESLAGVARQRSQLSEAMQEVESATAAPAARESWALDLLTRLRELEIAFKEHINDVQSPDGLLDGIVDQAPRLQRAVENRKLEHARLAESIEEVIEKAAGEGTVDIVVDMRESAMDLIVDLSRHRQQGADLIYDAYAVDIGGY